MFLLFISVKCDQSASFNGTFKENLQKLKNVVFDESLPWLKRLDSIRTKSQISTSFPVFVTAANQRFFVRSQGLVKGIIDRLLPVYKKVKIIYFDLGLTSSQRDVVSLYSDSFGCCHFLNLFLGFLQRFFLSQEQDILHVIPENLFQIKGFRF